jgi:rod shape-determining protein MreC
MKRRSERWKRLFLLGCLLLLTLGLATLRAPMVVHTAGVESFVVSLIMPLQAFVAGPFQQAYDVWERHVQLSQVHRENVRLKREIERLQGQLYRHQEAYLQQQRLRQLLEFRSLSFPTAIPAEVLGVDPSRWAEVIMISKGTADGVEKDRAILTHQGLIGHTIEAMPRYAKVLLITDRRSAVDALIQRTRARGLVVGKSRRLMSLQYVDVNEDVRVGDRIISSGLGDIYPKGLLLGTVTAVRPQPYGLFHEIDVRPVVDMLKLEEVLALGA